MIDGRFNKEKYLDILKKEFLPRINETHGQQASVHLLGTVVLFKQPASSEAGSLSIRDWKVLPWSANSPDLTP